MLIKITSKLTANEQQRLRRALRRGAELGYSDPFCPIHIGRNTYGVISEDYSDIGGMHDLARRLMGIAGRTFDYEVL